ncbi:MAG: hypothetical protein HN891_08235 [Planctomycetes bacterium]|jgi:hypothetical protein|nr:hypothetical protein [Planctomycetota bacterium]MBT6453269.1 hypothetical protein [Planctomycetota bacterium]MBT6540572.1 hypothetical protein [Planctomycetota bacterium]MBT6784435.1 hypothetical protein [Planctomycetota bacterium]MBT6968145.1 hypothetical protein [Planctomycetota bacterium]
MHEEDHKTSKALQSLLDEAARLEPTLNLAMDTVEATDPEAFLARLKQRIEQRQRQRRWFTAAAAALLLAAIILPFTMPDATIPGAGSSRSDSSRSIALSSLVESPTSELLEQLDVLELLEGLDPQLVATLIPSHIDTVDGFDLALADLPLELLVVEEEEE